MLVVEDDPDMRELLTELIAEHGHTVRGAPDAEAALKLHRDKPAELFILDWSLPGIDGLELCRRLRALPNGEDLIVIMITGRDGETDQVRALDAGANDYVAKPFSPHLFLTRVLVAERQIEQLKRRRQAEERVRRIGETAPGILYQLEIALNGDPHFLFVSEGARILFGIEPLAVERDAEVLFSRIHPDDRVDFNQRLAHSATTLDPLYFEGRVAMHSGAVRWTRATASGERMPDGSSVWNGILVDITQAKLTETALRDSETRFRRLIEQAPDAIWVARNDRLLYVNNALAQMLGFDGPDDLVGTPLKNLVHQDDLAAVRTVMNLETAPAERLKPMEFRLARRDGAWITLETSSMWLEYEGEPAVLTIARDVSEVLAMRARLMQADRMATVGTLSAGVAHEINNPLGYVLTNLRVLFETLEPLRGQFTPATWDEISSILRETRDGAERMRLIVRDLKTFSRPDDEQRAPLDVTRVLDSCVKLASNEIRHRAKLVKEYAIVAPVEANENRLGQVFLNLLINAVQSMPDRPSEDNVITMRTGMTNDGEVFVEVADTGRGIPLEQLDRIFDPFYTTKPGGTGLGLPIAQSIVTSLGGRIDVVSDEGSGTAFRVLLPASEAPKPKSRPATMPPPSMRATDPHARVLVIDDEPLVASALRRALREHEVFIINHGREAITRLTLGGEEYDVILCDLMMPDVPGAEVFEEVRKRRPELRDRFVFMSGGAFTAETRAFLERVENERIEKPFDVHALRALVRSRAPS